MYLITCSSRLCPLFFTDLILRATAEGGTVERHTAFALLGAWRAQKLMLWILKQRSSKSCEKHDALSQLCLKGSFARVPEPTWGRFQIPPSGHDPTPVAGSLSARLRAAQSAGLGLPVQGLVRPDGMQSQCSVSRLGFHLIINVHQDPRKTNF